MKNKNRLGFIGLGNMGMAIYRGVQENFDSYAYDPNPKNDPTIQYVSSLQELVEKSNVLLLCVKPAQVPEILESIQARVDLISIAAGITYDFLKSHLPKGSKIVRTMPNLPLMVGEGCIGYYGDTEMYNLIQEIFSPLGLVLEMPKEELLSAITGLSGSGPAFVLSFIQAMAEGGVKSGLSYSDSLNLSLQTIQGTVSYFSKEKEKNPNLHPSELRNRVTSAGGTTIFGLSEWEKNSIHYGIMESIYQANLRSQNIK